MARRPGPRGVLSETLTVKVSPQQIEELAVASLVLSVKPGEIVRTALDEFLRERRSALGPVVKSVRSGRSRVARRNEVARH